MPGLASDPGGAIVPFEPEPDNPVVYPIRINLRPPFFRIRVNWARGNLLHIACLRPNADVGDIIGGKVVEVKLGGAGDDEISDAERRRIAYGSVPAFALLQSRRNSLMAMARMSAASFRTEWWQHVSEYSNQISELLGATKHSSDSVIEDPTMFLQPVEKPTGLKAAWKLLKIFYVDKLSSAWLPEHIVDWLSDYDSLLSKTETTIHSKLAGLQKKLVNLQVVEDDAEYWEGISQALAVGWLDIAVKLLRLHGSYQLDQIDSRETENGLVEAVAVLVSTMPRMRPDLPTGKLGQCYKTKSDFIKAWEKWRGHIAKLDCSAFWVQCGHHRTREGLRNLLQIMLGNLKNITNATCHWMELCISHLLYMRPFTVVQAGAGGTESMDWASMVMNMYMMWAQRRGFNVTVVEEMPGEIAGIKRATIKVDGEYAYGYAKAEVGVHRLVRISPFDSGKRRHTSFAAVAVIPILGDVSTRFQIKESDLRIERFRSGGAGGQHANTTDSAVRIVHIPTGITATCQNERSQHSNKASAMAVLQSRLDQLEMTRQAQMNAEHTQSLTEISWGNQIRTYVLHPYRMVKDLRTSYEVSDPDSVLEGDLDGFILNFLSATLVKDEEK